MQASFSYFYSGAQFSPLYTSEDSALGEEALTGTLEDDGFATEAAEPLRSIETDAPVNNSLLTKTVGAVKSGITKAATAVAAALNPAVALADGGAYRASAMIAATMYGEVFFGGLIFFSLVVVNDVAYSFVEDLNYVRLNKGLQIMTSLAEFGRKKDYIELYRLYHSEKLPPAARDHARSLLVWRLGPDFEQSKMFQS